jgi:two-component system cell cycle response regulator
VSSLPAQGTLLIVDDERAGREALEGLLLNQGYRLHFASGGAEAMEVIQQMRPDLVLLDVMMPGMDGFEVCRQVRSNPLTAEIPILLVTALDDRETRLEGITAGADDFISKPYDRGELRLRVKTIMRIGRYRRLLNERARFNSVVENASNGYIVVKDDGSISYANGSARSFLNLPAPGALAGYGLFFEMARKQYRLEPDCAWTDDDLRVPNRHYLVRPETATARAFWLSVTLIEPGSDSNERLMRLRDVTEEMGVQRDRHSFQRIIGHKLRTPLNGIVSVLELLNGELAGGPQEEMATLALDSAERLARSVEEILEFAALSDQPGEHQEPYALASLPDLVERLRLEMEIATVDRAIDPALLAEKITLSPLQFETVFREIFENARKFHPKRQPWLRLIATWGRDRRTLRVALRDDGVSLAPDQLAQVWMPYYQGEKRTTGEVEGMGLGLSVVKSIVVSKGGSIRLANNADGPGIEVTLELPLA